LNWLGSLWWNQPTRVQILDLTRVLAFTANYSFSGRRRTRRQRGACGDFVNLKICRPSLPEVLIGVGCACVRS
ncbi:Os12g0256600, partial [Oryza sativa Japonica Group]